MEMKKDNSPSKAIAMISGKGGSGKTMVAASMATVLDSLGYKVLLIDADFGTAGLTYYMGLNTVANISVGLTNLSSLPVVNDEDVYKYSQTMKNFGQSRFISIGDHRRYLKSSSEHEVDILFNKIINTAKLDYDFILIDCRGGIDYESLMVCKSVDDIIIVAETDTTSFQATQYLVDTLYDNELSGKIAGFLINKVFDDPSTIARAGTASFRSQYLDSVPFDLDATKSFLVGDIPSKNSMFSSQIWHVLYKLYPEVIKLPNLRSLDFNDYRGLSLRDNDSLLGGMIISFSALAFGGILIYERLLLVELDRTTINMALIFLIILSVFSGIEPARRGVGRAFSSYKKLVTKVFSGS
mgnify:CR=1 FL=1